MPKYIIISPVRNEEALIEKTIEAVASQTVLPQEWIIVNDGSTDSTRKVIEKYLGKYPWIKLINLEDRGYYFPGTGVVNVISNGYNNISKNGWEYLVKLDCDVTIEKDYFESIFKEFQINDKLGIASGAVYLKEGEKEVKEKSLPDHPWGASKIYKQQCFHDIGGWKPIPGWDLADLLAAQMKGWETRCFDEHKIMHYRQSGSRRNGITQGRFLLGRFLFRYGYNFFYAFLKGVFRLFEPPYIIGGISIILGYMVAFLRNEEKLFDKEMRKFLRKKQNEYVRTKIKGFFH